jgi:hypothetical protein
MKKITAITAFLISSSVMAETTKPVSAFEQFIAKTTPVNSQAKAVDNRGVTIVTVGTDVTCDYQNDPIQDAIDDGFVHIRVAAGTYTENLTLGNSNMTIEGGYADCLAADNDDLTGGGTTAIVGSNNPASSVITIPNTADVNDVLFRRFTIRNGGQASLPFGGGISILNSPSNITLENLIISSNNANFGGGIAVLIGSPNIIIQDTLILSNTGQSGGGISCNASNEAVINFLDTGSAATGGIFNNTATQRNGGGVELIGGCQFILYSGQDPDNIIDFRGIISNSTVANGGGVSVSSGSTFTAAGFQFFAGNNDAPATIRANTADSDTNDSGNGGGIFVTGEGSTANLLNVNMQDNIAYDGGAVSAEEGGVVTTESVNFVFPCWSPGKCNRFQGNTARNTGGVFYTNQTSDLGTAIEVFSSQIYNNTATGQGSVSYISGTDASFFMEGSVVYENPGFTALYNFTNTSATYQFNTIADNDVGFSVIRNFRGTTRLTSSIVHNNNADDVFSNDTPVSETFDCLITHEDASFTGTSTTQVSDPQFVDRANDDYHINAFLSPAVDYCDTFITTPERDNDIDNQPRGWDDYIAGNEFGVYDIGADETYDNDVIFKNSFD